MNIRPMGADLFLAHGQTDRHDDANLELRHLRYVCNIRYSVRKSKTQLFYYVLIVLLIERHVSPYSEAVIRFNKY